MHHKQLIVIYTKSMMGMGGGVTEWAVGIRHNQRGDHPSEWQDKTNYIIEIPR